MPVRSRSGLQTQVSEAGRATCVARIGVPTINLSADGCGIHAGSEENGRFSNGLRGLEPFARRLRYFAWCGQRNEILEKRSAYGSPFAGRSRVGLSRV
jgi:hypothetical protein